MAEPFVLPSAAGQDVSAFGASIVLRDAPQVTGGAISLIEGTWHPGGFAPLPHIHLAEDEHFYTLAGQFEFRLDDTTVVADPGTLVSAPRGVLHGFKAIGDGPARLIAWHTPGIGQFFVELAELGAHGPPDPTKLSALMQQWNMEVPTKGMPT